MPEKTELTSAESLLIIREVNHLLGGYGKVASAILAMFAVLGLAGIYGLVSQSLSAALNDRLKNISERIEKATSEERARVIDFYNKLQEEGNEASRAAERMKTSSEKAANDYIQQTTKNIEKVKTEATKRIDDLVDGRLKELTTRIGQTELLNEELNKRIKNIDADLTKFREAVSQGAKEIAENPEFTKSVVSQVNTQVTELEKKFGDLERQTSNLQTTLQAMTDGYSGLNASWSRNGNENDSAFSLVIGKNRLLLSGLGGRVTFGTYDPSTRKITTDANNTPSWPNNHVGILSPDGRKITWQAENTTWTR